MLTLIKSVTCSLLVLFSLTLVSGAELSVPAWEIPAGWKQQAGERPMRVATFNAGADATAIEIAVSTFPGDAGGLLANVNRWRGQVGLAPVTNETLAPTLSEAKSPGFTVYTMRLAGAAKHMLGAVITDDAQQRTWFIKATASEAAAGAHEAAFIAFAKSFKNK
jgi:hypothetical protein